MQGSAPAMHTQIDAADIGVVSILPVHNILPVDVARRAWDMITREDASGAFPNEQERLDWGLKKLVRVLANTTRARCVA